MKVSASTESCLGANYGRAGRTVILFSGNIIVLPSRRLISVAPAGACCNRLAGRLAQLSQNSLPVASSVIAGKAGQRCGDHLMVMQFTETRLASDTEPEAMN